MAHGGLLPHAYRRRGNGTPIACGRSPTGATPIDNTTFYATLIINSNIGHAEYMQPRWFFCVNCHPFIEHRKVRARVEHTFAAMKTWKILRDCRRRGRGEQVRSAVSRAAGAR